MAIKDRAPSIRRQIRDFIMQQIDSGQLVPHDPISSVAELEAQFGASKATIQFAVDGLIREGVLYRRRRGPRPGVFVRDPNMSVEVSEDEAPPVIEAKIEVQCLLGHRTWIRSETPVQVCLLCGTPSRPTGRFQNRDLTLDPSGIVPAAHSMGAYRVTLPDGCVYSI